MTKLVGGAHTIQVGNLTDGGLGALPTITDAVIIDGTSEPSFTTTPIVVLDGTSAGVNIDGLVLGAGSGGSTIRGLVINKFGGSGIEINGSDGNTIVGNFIGTDVTGALDLGNSASGLYILSAKNNTIGGTTTADRNVISGNQGSGILRQGSSGNNAIRGNYIGTDVTGTLDVGNSQNGIGVSGSGALTIGGTVAGAGNVISGNSQDGIAIGAGANGVTIQGNRVGTNATGTTTLANGGDGVAVNADNTQIGGTTALVRNLISGNAGDGLQLSGDSNTVQGNYIGVDVAGSGLLSNNLQGIRVTFNADNNTIGGTTAGARNIISGNGEDGIRLDNATNTMIQGNYIGLNAAGTAALGNSQEGINLLNTTTNTSIGGTLAGAANVISGNAGEGLIIGGASAGTVVQQNRIGTNAAGTGALGNASNGILITADGITIGGTSASARNVISGNILDGINLVSAAGTVIQGNYIGTDITGTMDLGNLEEGISVFTSTNTVIGGTALGAGNVIAGNSRSGIYDNASSGTTIRGNTIGVDAMGTATLTNGHHGVSLWVTSSATVGGTGAQDHNVIGGNTLQGILLFGNGGHTVQGNYIGTDVTGTLDLGNLNHGIVASTSSDHNVIGGTGADEGNTIAFNSDGIAIGTIGNLISGNVIYANDALGIDLAPDGVTANDADDSDSGANNLQNFPVLSTAATTGTQIAIQGVLTSTASTAFRLEFFASTTADGSGHGEAERTLGPRTVTTAATGIATFTFMFNHPVANGEFVTATATNLATNDTLEFALNIVAVAGLDSDGDGVLDLVEDRNLDGDSNPATGPPLDTDGDGTLDYLDTDDDGDGMLTASEDLNGNGDPTDDDSDGDGIPNYLDPDGTGMGPGDSDMDGVADDVECPSGPPCTDSDGDGIPNYNDPDHNTLVQQLTMKAGIDPMGVWLTWSTGFEVDNIGFRVYREVAGKRVPVTPSLIAGSAFIAGPGTALPAGHSYAWQDAAGLASDVYWLQDIDLQGQLTWHGPVSPQFASSIPGVPTPSPLLARLGQGRQVQTRPTATRPRIVPPRADVPTLRAPDSPPAWENAALSPAERQLALVASPAVIVTIDAPGWYRVHQTDLVQAGFAPDIDTRYLRLFALGVEQSLYVRGETLEFYAEGLDTLWTDTQRYWLAVGTQPGARVRQAESSGQAPTGPTAFPFAVTHRERTVYVPAVRNGSAENFFGAVLRDQPVAQVLLLQGLAPRAPGEASLTIALQSVSPEPHEIRVEVNGHNARHLRVEAQAHHVGTFAIPQSWLTPGANVITLHPLQPETTLSLVDHIALTYWRTYTAHQDQLRSTVPAMRDVTLDGFTDATIRVFDITPPTVVTELLGPVTQHGAHYRITVTPTGAGERQLLAL